MEAFSPVKRVQLALRIHILLILLQSRCKLKQLITLEKNSFVINDKFWKTNKNLRKLLITPVNNEDSPCKWAPIPTFVISVLISDDSIAI